MPDGALLWRVSLGEHSQTDRPCRTRSATVRLSRRPPGHPSSVALRRRCPRSLWQGGQPMNESLLSTLKQLRLSGMAETLEVRLHEAQSSHLTYAEFLELVMQDEMLVRGDRKLARRLKAASFRDLKSLEDFDWSFNRSIKKSELYELATGRFIGEHRDVLFYGPPGTGKSH